MSLSFQSWRVLAATAAATILVSSALYGPSMGGLWVMGGMMGPTHGGIGWTMVGPSWRGSNGSYGMEFVFTTA